MTSTEKFCRLLRERSIDNTTSVSLSLNNELYGQVISTLRQELDSMVRVIFLLQIVNIQERNHYIDQTINKNVKWTYYPNSRKVITDSIMVDLGNHLHGWIRSVYKLGCAFIHLSPLIDYRNENPFLKIPEPERNDIKQHLHDYHQFPLQNELNMETIKPYLQKVFKKVRDNLSSYINELEGERIEPL